MLTRENRKIEGMMKMRMEWNNNGNQNMVSKLAGIALVVVGMIIAGNALGWWNVSLFFRGWWTLFIIIPSVIGLFDSRETNKTGNLVRNNHWCCFTTCSKRNN